MYPIFSLFTMSCMLQTYIHVLTCILDFNQCSVIRLCVTIWIILSRFVTIPNVRAENETILID